MRFLPGVTGGIDKGDGLPVAYHLVRPDMLSDPASFAGDDPRAPIGIKQRRFPVIDMTHEGNHRRTDEKLILLDLLNGNGTGCRHPVFRRRGARRVGRLAGDAMNINDE